MGQKRLLKKHQNADPLGEWSEYILKRGVKYNQDIFFLLEEMEKGLYKKGGHNFQYKPIIPGGHQ